MPTVPQPPENIYLFPYGVQQIANERTKSFIIDHLDFSFGINIFIKDALYPKKGFPTPEAIFACNLLKRFIVKFPLMLWKLKDFNEIGMKVLSPFMLKEQYQTPITREIHGFIFLFLRMLKYEGGVANDFASIFSHLIEYDNAYRYRLEDIMSETTKKRMIERPIGELKRLLKIEISRDDKGVSRKFKRLVNLLCLALLIPRVRRAYRFALEDSNFKNFQYDEDDKYWCCMRKDYLFMGKNYKNRQKMYKQYPKEQEIKI